MPDKSSNPSITLTEEQEHCLNLCLDASSPYSLKRETVITGYAGTGKTTLLRTLIPRIEATGRRVVLLAPTGKAAVNAYNLTGKSAKTIHRALYSEVDEKEDGPQFGDPQPPCGSRETVIVDEASMFWASLHKVFMEELPQSSNVIHVGDHGQLPPVKDTWGPDLTKPDGSLSRVHRQALNSQIIQYATAIRKNLVKEWSKQYDPTNSDLQVVRHIDSVVDWLVEHRQQEADATVLSYTHNTRKYINNRVRERLGLHRHPISVGDKLLIKANNPIVGLMNGDVVTVTSTSWHHMLKHMSIEVQECQYPLIVNIELIDADPREFYKHRAKLKSKKRYNDIKHMVHVHQGQCITIHSSQGSAWENVAVVADNAFTNLARRDNELYKRLKYTAVTRASKHLLYAPI